MCAWRFILVVSANCFLTNWCMVFEPLTELKACTFYFNGGTHFTMEQGSLCIHAQYAVKKVLLYFLLKMEWPVVRRSTHK